MKKNLTVLLILFVGVAGFTWFFSQNGQSAPAITLTDIDGKTHTTINNQAPTLITFWATSCVTCVAEMPDLKALYDQWQPAGFNLLAIAMSHDSSNAIQTFRNQNALRFPVFYDRSDVAAKAFDEVRLTPTHFLVSKSGRILYHGIGLSDFAHLHELIQQDIESS